MSLAGIDEQELPPGPIAHGHHANGHHADDAPDDAPDSPSPDDYYKSACPPAPEHDAAKSPPAVPPSDMSVTRPRQHTASSSNVRSPARGGPRSVSGPASSVASSRSPPQTSNKVRALTERFERSPGSDVIPSVIRSRSREPTRAGAHDPVRRQAGPACPPVLAARPPKEAAYGSYQFKNLKPRERPQAAPTSPPRTARRATNASLVSRSSIDHTLSPARHARASSSGRQLFGEIVGGQDASLPGFMIPTFASTAREEALQAAQVPLPPINDAQDLAGDDVQLPATTFIPAQHQRSQSNATTTSTRHRQTRPSSRSLHSPPRHSPPSRIPIMSQRSRRSSNASDASSSVRSVRYTPTRSNRSSPNRGMTRKPVGGSTPVKSNGVDHATLPALAYRGYRERGKSPARTGPSVPAVVTAPPPPASPRLRNSRERQPLQSPHAHPRAGDSHGEHEYFSLGDQLHSKPDPLASQPGLFDGESESQTLDFSFSPSSLEENQSPSSRRQHSLSLQTFSLGLPPPTQPWSAVTDFEESPTLGLPGSFVLTPPEPQQEPEPQLLRPAVFRAQSSEQVPELPPIEESILGVRESIPIMFNDEHLSGDINGLPMSQQEETQRAVPPRRSVQVYGHETLLPALHFKGEDSPTDSFHDRDSLHPDDSISVAPYRSQKPMHTKSDTYSVINSVLNLYHQSPVISPELALLSRQRVQQVSPVIAQHQDWASKEATETYLARILSDANGMPRDSAQEPPHEREALPLLTPNVYQARKPSPECANRIPAFVFPQESQCYSRGSQGSATTLIQEDASPPGSSFGNPSQDALLSNVAHDDAAPSTNGLDLPQLAWTSSGLGLSMNNYMPPSPTVPSPTAQEPPRPVYSPPPPPPAKSLDELPPISPSIASYSFSGHAKPSPASQTDERFEQHPARALTPVGNMHDRNYSDIHSTPRSMEISDKPLPEIDMAEEETPAAPEETPPDPARQALTKRYRILEEMLTTEHQFCIDMMIAHNIFEATAGSIMTEKEKRALFSNCKDLEKFSLSLFRAFKKAAKPIVNHDMPPPTGPWSRDSTDSKSFGSAELPANLRSDEFNQFENCTLENDHQTSIGNVFLENLEKMERLYTTYYLNSQNQHAYIKKNQSNPELTGWVVACFEQVENMTQAWDLDSLLVKPAQRLLKYPLLLESLEQCTDADHPDLVNITKARLELLAISGRINDAKKRADTFRAATSEGKKEKSKGKGLGNAFVKAFIPKADKTKTYDEAEKTFKDMDYKSREQKFGGHFFQLQIVMRDFENYLDSITEHYLQLNIVFLGFITVCEVAPSVNPEIESTWRKWAMAHFELQNKALEDHKAAVRSRVLKPISDLWEMWVSYQKTIEQRKKLLINYVKHKQAVERGEKPDPETVAYAERFTTINDTLKLELPMLYDKTKAVMRSVMTLFMALQKDWYKTCSKKILPLLETEPQHTTSIDYDLKAYVERFKSDYNVQEQRARSFGITNSQRLLQEISSMTSPIPSDGAGSARNSHSRRTESMSSEASGFDPRNRHSGGYSSRSNMRSMDGPPRSLPAGPAYTSLYQNTSASSRNNFGAVSSREAAKALSPVSDNSDTTMVRHQERRNSARSRNHNYLGMDGVIDFDDRSSFGAGIFDFPPQLGASFLSPTQSSMLTMSAPSSQPPSLPGSTRQSGVFNSALPMSDTPMRSSAEDLPITPGDTDEPEVLFLAASLFEFNIAHDRREGGIPYLVYVPGEIFDVIGMKGELWLARNQDDATKTVGWIWEKHFARILPEDA
ncbi:uncharacterized protein M421DRAFT_389251 [Didymella exigua CBS 183.55]|uniref:DH domain-containing protein n=1 Tax=Didymella exigua CBS 183.55 TaxID=1150837 RepID=A0A6A5RPF9_9PLEO|nr:uncharacterized protein M421DRAFT_389251 [Didymella exigua CBS 183.55]KAF1929539.1 hypothetical protein M421DRAFT_389251 [Didymella exigua CBS 183.55]